MRPSVLIAVAVAFNSAPALASDYNEGEQALTAGYGGKAYALFSACAQTGDLDCQNAMGVMFERGASPTTPKSDKDAIVWYQRAAEHGHPLAMTNLGEALLRMGETLQGMAWLKASAGLGELNALARLEQLDLSPATVDRHLAEPDAPAPVPSPPAIGNCKGSVKKGLKAYQVGDNETALCHWLPKAQAGDAVAQNNMGVLFENGLSAHTPRSDERAAEWYLLSAQKGFVLGMRNLATVQRRLGYHDAANSWIAQAAATEQQQAVNQQQAQAGLASLGYAIGCALAGGCAAPAAGNYSNSYTARSHSLPNMTIGVTQQRATGVSPQTMGGGGARLCPNGQYVEGSCHMAPDGSYVGGTPRIAPDGTYVGGQPRMAPDGSYVGGNTVTMCPDGSYVGARRCVIAPDGTYVGAH